MHGEKSILQQIKSSWLCGQRWVKPQPFGYKGSKSHGFQTGFILSFWKSVHIRMTKNHSTVKAETSA